MTERARCSSWQKASRGTSAVEGRTAIVRMCDARGGLIFFPDDNDDDEDDEDIDDDIGKADDDDDVSRSTERRAMSRLI